MLCIGHVHITFKIYDDFYYNIYFFSYTIAIDNPLNKNVINALEMYSICVSFK